MTAPKQIRRILAELRAAVGPEVPAWELLQLAYVVLEAHQKPEFADFDDPTPRSPFSALEVDAAVRRGDGFAVLDFERRQGMSFTDERSDDYYEKEARIRGIVGIVTWPRFGTE